MPDQGRLGPFLVARLGRDRSLRREVETARTLGISLRRFQGWEPVTRHVPGGTQPDAEWDDEQQAWMLALALLEADTCKGCGGRLSETTALDEFGVSVHEYEADPPHQCFRCTALAAGHERLAKEESMPSSAALWSVSESVRPTREVVTDG